MSDKIILVSEIFGPTVQGEGLHIGQPTVFVRTGGCDFLCTWCDTLYAVLPQYNPAWIPMTAEAIGWRVYDLVGDTATLITLSGGNPAMQKNMGEVIDVLHQAGHQVTIETQGTVYPKWVDKLDYITVSPKPPSSGMKINHTQLRKWIEGEHVQPVFKVVIFDDQDYLFACWLHKLYPTIKMYLQVGNPVTPITIKGEQREEAELVTQRLVLFNRLEWLINKVLADKWTDCTVLPQLHTLLYGNKRGI